MAQNIDAKQYYGYLFEADKKPTKVLDALLRGIATYIVSRDSVDDYTLLLKGIKADLIEHLSRGHGTADAHA
jgi:hypothetical protein